MFRSKFSEDIFVAKYQHTGCETWAKLADVVVEDVCGKLPEAKGPHHKQLLTDDEMQLLKEFIRDLNSFPVVVTSTMPAARGSSGTTATCCEQKRTRARTGPT